MAAPYTEPTGLMSFSDIILYIDTNIGGIFAPGIVFTVFIISVLAIVGKTNDLLQGVSISSFFCFIISVLFVYMGIGKEIMALLFLLIAITTTAYMYYKSYA